MHGHLNSKRALFGLSLLAALVMSLITAPVPAQVVGATLSGTITDPSGAVIPKATITIQNTATGVVRNVQSNADGLYFAPNLLPGSYTVTISAPGFSTEVHSNVVLTVGANQVLNITLQVGRVSSVVRVTSAPPTVQLGSSAISAVVRSTTVRELPLNGRSWTDLAKLQPGVDAIVTQPSFATGADRGNRGFGGQLTISGQRPVQNNYRLDGVSLNDYSNGAPGSVLGGNLGVDAIQEFSVLTSNYSAEYGKTSGGVVNATTKSGTNAFHGDVYEFLRNDALDAANFFDNFSGSPKPAFRRNQFGASAGGPIQKDKTFFFGDYEGIRQSKGFSIIDTVLSPAARAGDLTSGTVAVDPAAAQYLGFFPLPNGPVSGDTGFFSFPSDQVITENFWTARIDRTFSSKDSLFGTYMYDVTPYHQPDGLNNVLINTETNRQFVVLEETHTFSPSLVNSVRGGYNRDGVSNNVGTAAINPLAADKSLAAVPGETAAQVNMPGVTHFTGGVLGNAYYHYYWNSFQGYDDAFYTRGTHSIKFGFAAERMQNNVLAAKDPSGAFNFPSISAFLTNQPSRFEAGLSSTLTPRGLRQTLLGTYVQDDWRARPNLTLNLGLRWEMITMPSEVQGKLVNLSTIYSPAPLTGSTFINNPTLHNFEPRVGFAWDPFHNGKTAVRGGFGVFDALPLPVEFTLMETQQVPFFQNPTINPLPSGTFYAGALPLAQATPGTGGASYFPIDAKRNYILQWNMNIQREIAPNLTAMVGYIGSRGVHDGFRSDDIDMVLPTSSSAGYLFPSPLESGYGIKFNPNFGIMHGQIWAADSFYHSLGVAVRKTMSHGLQLEGSFTWGKSIDEGSASAAGDQFANSLSSLPFYDLHAIRAVSDFNVGRTLVINGIWDLPTPKTWTGVSQYLLGGWELGGIFTASDGVPFTATWGTDGDPQGLNSSDPWDFPNLVKGPGCNSLVNPGNPNNYIKTQCFSVPTAPSLAFYNANCDPANPFPACFNLRGNAGRNILTGPGVAELDASLYKNIPVRRISENFNIQFRAEFFNVLNRANFAPPILPDNTDIFDSTGASTGVAGLLTSTTTDPREIQFALKVNW
jgi:Carboxypeptidase regulatory-like domain/TonB-dependent Receptor Plug Domain